MALVRRFERSPMERNSLHDEISATYAVIQLNGRTLVQIDTFGRDTRENPGKKSQTIQLDEEGARDLVNILRGAFHFP